MSTCYGRGVYENILTIDHPMERKQNAEDIVYILCESYFNIILGTYKFVFVLFIDINISAIICVLCNVRCEVRFKNQEK